MSGESTNKLWKCEHFQYFDILLTVHLNIFILILFLISNFRRVLNLLYILLGVSPASDCCMPTFRNPLSVPSSRAEPPTTWRLSPHWFCQLQQTSALVYKYYVLRSLLILYIQPLKMEPIEDSETSAYNNQTPGKHPKEYIIDLLTYYIKYLNPVVTVCTIFVTFETVHFAFMWFP